MARSPTPNDQLTDLQRLARLLDSSIRLPGGYRIGLDGIIGLVPGIGDAVAATLSTYIVVRGARLGASTMTLVRMMGNILLELVVGFVPVLGDLFDFAWKANNRNIALLERHASELSGEGSAGRRLTTATLVLLAAFLLLIGLILVGLISLLVNLLQLLGAG